MADLNAITFAPACPAPTAGAPGACWPATPAALDPGWQPPAAGCTRGGSAAQPSQAVEAVGPRQDAPHATAAAWVSRVRQRRQWQQQDRCCRHHCSDPGGGWGCNGRRRGVQRGPTCVAATAAATPASAVAGAGGAAGGAARARSAQCGRLVTMSLLALAASHTVKPPTADSTNNGKFNLGGISTWEGRA